MLEFFKDFSFPGGIGSHCTPETPGSIHEGGELGYSVSHAFGAAFDNPDLLVAVVVGDGEAETGPLATSWHSTKFLNPIRDGAVLPVLHLNGYKINNPTLLSRISHDELENLFKGYGWTPHFVEGDDPTRCTRRWPRLWKIASWRFVASSRKRERATGHQAALAHDRAAQPQGLDGPKEVDGHKVEGFWRSHQVPLAGMHTNPAHLKQLDDWLRSYKPEELFDQGGRLIPELKALPLRANGAWAPILTPMGLAAASHCACRTSATMPSK
jgi:xylulose-5-phosphate/fructose-6-phosphate phosphoketolase